ncbi:MAG: GNAT family protein [Chloroflexota bacterium]
MTVTIPYLTTGARTAIRPFTRRDVDRWQAWPRHTDPLYEHFDPKPMSGSMRDAWYDEVVHRQRQIPFAIDALGGEDRQMIGRIFLRDVNREQTVAELGIDLSPAHIGRGLGTEALLIFLDHYFGPMGFRAMVLTVAAFNVRARRSYERLGFTYGASHWSTFRARTTVLNHPRYADVRDLFRPGTNGFETLMLAMALDAVRFATSARHAHEHRADPAR